jgi:hypothetical protein
MFTANILDGNPQVCLHDCIMSAQDIRYNADGTKTAHFDTVIFPLWLCVDSPTYHKVICDARGIVEQLQAEILRFTAKGGTLQMGDLGKPQIQKTSELVLEHISSDQIRLQLEFFLVLTLQKGHFWERAELIGLAIDFIQKFCARTCAKYVDIQMKTARFVDENQQPQINVQVLSSVPTLLLKNPERQDLPTLGSGGL